MEQMPREQSQIPNNDNFASKEDVGIIMKRMDTLTTMVKTLYQFTELQTKSITSHVDSALETQNLGSINREKLKENADQKRNLLLASAMDRFSSSSNALLDAWNYCLEQCRISSNKSKEDLNNAEKSYNKILEDSIYSAEKARKEAEMSKTEAAKKSADIMNMIQTLEDTDRTEKVATGEVGDIINDFLNNDDDEDETQETKNITFSNEIDNLKKKRDNEGLQASTGYEGIDDSNPYQNVLGFAKFGYEFDLDQYNKVRDKFGLKKMTLEKFINTVFDTVRNEVGSSKHVILLLHLILRQQLIKQMEDKGIDVDEIESNFWDDQDLSGGGGHLSGLPRSRSPFIDILDVIDRTYAMVIGERFSSHETPGYIRDYIIAPTGNFLNESSVVVLRGVNMFFTCFIAVLFLIKEVGIFSWECITYIRTWLKSLIRFIPVLGWFDATFTTLGALLDLGFLYITSFLIAVIQGKTTADVFTDFIMLLPRLLDMCMRAIYKFMVVLLNSDVFKLLGQKMGELEYVKATLQYAMYGLNTCIDIFNYFAYYVGGHQFGHFADFSDKFASSAGEFASNASEFASNASEFASNAGESIPSNIPYPFDPLEFQIKRLWGGCNKFNGGSETNNSLTLFNERNKEMISYISDNKKSNTVEIFKSMKNAIDNIIPKYLDSNEIDIFKKGMNTLMNMNETIQTTLNKDINNFTKIINNKNSIIKLYSNISVDPNKLLLLHKLRLLLNIDLNKFKKGIPLATLLLESNKRTIPIIPAINNNNKKRSNRPMIKGGKLFKNKSKKIYKKQKTKNKLQKNKQGKTKKHKKNIRSQRRYFKKKT